MPGPDRSRPSLRVLLGSNAAWSPHAQWHDRAASFPISFLFCWASGPNFQPSDAASNAARSARAKWHDRAAFFPRKKNSAQIWSIGPVHRTEDRICQKSGPKRTSPVRAGPRSGPVLDRNYTPLAKIKLRDPNTLSSCHKDFKRSQKPSTSSHIFLNLKNVWQKEPP